MANDITNPNTHLYWLWLAVALLAGIGGKGYLSLRAADDCLADKVYMNDVRLQVQLTKIETQLLAANATLLELKDEVKRGNK